MRKQFVDTFKQSCYGLSIFLFFFIGKSHAQETIDICDRGEIAQQLARQLNARSCSEIDPAVMANKVRLSIRNKGRIDKIGSKAFEGFNSLKYLRFIGSETYFEPTVFSNLQNLEHLEIRTGDSNFSFDILNEVPTLKSLIFQLNSSTQHIDLSTLKSNSLQTLVLNGHRHMDVNIDISKMKMPTVISLTLSNFKGSKLDLTKDSFSGFKNLKSLYLYKVEISSLSKQIFAPLSQLKRLKLEESNISEWKQEAMIKLRNLEFLHLDYLNQENFSKNLFAGLTNLKELVLSDGWFDHIPPNVFTDLNNLLVLSIVRHRLYKKAFSQDSFNGLTRLRKLSIIRTVAGPVLLHIPAMAFSELKNLKTLSLYDSKVGTIEPYAFHNLFNLEKLNISETNNLLRIPQNAFGRIRGLKWIDISGNLNLSIIEDNVFQNMEDLVEIDTTDTCLMPSNGESKTEYLRRIGIKNFEAFKFGYSSRCTRN